MKKLLVASACVIAMSTAAMAQSGSGLSAGSTSHTQAGDSNAKGTSSGTSSGAMHNNMGSGTTGANVDNMKRDKTGVPGNDAAGSGNGGGAVTPGGSGTASGKSGG